MKDAAEKGVIASVTQTEKNTRELSAWNEWKTVCKIYRCSPVNREALVERMWTSSRTKLDALLSSSNPGWESEYTTEGWGMEIAQAFDGYIREGEENPKRLNYKDLVWNLIAAGQDAPLKIIRGKLTGKRRVLDNVLERFVTSHGLAIGVSAHFSVTASSLNEPIVEGENAGAEKGDLLKDDRQELLPDDAVTEWRHRFLDMFNYQDCVILLAYFRRVAFTEDVFVEASGVKKSRAGEILKGKFDGDGNQVQEGLLDKLACLREDEDFRELVRQYGQAAVAEMIIGILKGIVQVEKRSSRLLSMIEEYEGN